jgi:hypothetical protein
MTDGETGERATRKDFETIEQIFVTGRTLIRSGAWVAAIYIAS